MYFTNTDLVKQVELVIEIFEEWFRHLAQALFAFDNTTSHQKHIDDTLSALKMPKSTKQ